MQSTLRHSGVESRTNLSNRQNIDSLGWSGPQQPVEHLLVATDLTQRSDRAIERSLELADLLKTQLTLLHVVDEGLPRRLIKHRRREAQALLQEHIRMLLSPNASRDVSINVRTGDISAEIAREAIELGSDAIILGMQRQHSRGYGRYERMAAKVVHYSDRAVLIVKHEPKGPYRSAVIHVESLSDPTTALRVSSRLAPCAEPHIIANCSTAPSMGAREAYTALSSQSLRRIKTSNTCRTCALERRPYPKPITVHPYQKVGAAVDAFQGDLLVVEVCHSGEGRGLPPDDAVRKIVDDPPCDLLVVRGRDNCKC